MIFKILFTKKFYNFIFKNSLQLFFKKKGFTFLLNKLIFIFYLKNEFHIDKKNFVSFILKKKNDFLLYLQFILKTILLFYHSF